MDVDHYDLSKAIGERAIANAIPFRLEADYKPSGDQEKAIEEIISQLENGQERCILLGVTGSGKTFTIANLIQQSQRTTLLLAPNKRLLLNSMVK